MLFDAPVVLLRSPARDAAANMACDEAMRHAAAAHRCTVVRLYTWTRPALSLGRHQQTAGRYAAHRCEALGIPAVRRPTGGRALLHAREQTYAVAAPVDRAPTLATAYEAINQWLADALQRLGVPVTVAQPAAPLAPPGLAPCFAEPAAGELVLDGRKLVGSAQARDEATLLQHGSILLANDQDQLAALALVPLPPIPPPATLGPEVDAAAVADALTEALGARCPSLVIPPDDLDWLGEAVNVALLRYRDPAWTWCR